MIVVLSGAPAAHRWLARTVPELAARLPRWARIGSPARRRNQLRHRIVDGVVQRSSRADGVLSLPDAVVVTLDSTDCELVDRRFLDDLQREWSALAAAEGWSAPPAVAVEIVEGTTGLLRRPRLTLAYEPAAHHPTDAAGAATATPLNRGPFLVTPDNRCVSLLPRRSIVVGRGPVDVQVDADYVSRSHAELTLLPDGSVQVRDLRSSNKTFVDGVEVDNPVVMRGPGRIGLGTRFSVELRWPS